MPIVILDTNVFLQYRDLRELPWTELVGKGRVNLLIPLTVQRELERHKADGNSRRSTRARKTIPLFRQLVHSSEESVLLDGTSDVRVKLMRLRRLDSEKYPELDLNAPDQRIIAEILRAIEDGLEEVPILATADTFLCGVAKQFDVRFVELPDEWRLPEEPDSRGKELKELRSRVERLEGNRPALSVKLFDGGGQQLEQRIEFLGDVYDAMRQEQIEFLVARAKGRFPLKVPTAPPRHNGAAGFNIARLGGQWVPPSANEIEAYGNSAYPEWVAALHAKLERLHTDLEANASVLRIRIEVSNQGERPAEKVLVRLFVDGAATIITANGSADSAGVMRFDVSLPKAPAPPEYEFRSSFTDFASIGSTLASPRFDTPVFPDIFHRSQDRNAFYAHARDGELTTIVYECEEFRHQHKAGVFDCELFIPNPPDGEKSSARLLCQVHAANLSQPLELSMPILVSRVSKETGRVALEMVDSLELASKEPTIKGTRRW